LFSINKKNLFFRCLVSSKWVLLTLVLFFLFSNCFLFQTHKLAPTSIGYYGNTPEQQYDQGKRRESSSRTSDFTFDEVFDAANKALLRLGLNIEQSDYEKGMITGNGNSTIISSVKGPCVASHTFACYITEISAEPITRVTVIVDTHSGDNIQVIGLGKKMSLAFLESIHAEIQKVLSTYR